MFTQRCDHLKGFGLTVGAMPNGLTFMMVSVASGGNKFVAFGAFLRLDDLDLFQNGGGHGLSWRFGWAFHNYNTMGVT